MVRRMTGLLLGLGRRPKLLVLDEPTTGLAPVARYEVLAEMMDVLTYEDRSILFSSQNTLDVEQISDQNTFIDRGRIIESRDRETFLGTAGGGQPGNPPECRWSDVGALVAFITRLEENMK